MEKEIQRWSKLKDDDLWLFEKPQRTDLEYAEAEIMNLRDALHNANLKNVELVTQNPDLQMPTVLQGKFESEIGKFGDFSFVKTEDGQYQTRLLQNYFTHWLAHQHETKYSHAFRNFHRLLCERFEYVHDPQFWWRDQLSLIEYIAARIPNEQHVDAK